MQLLSNKRILQFFSFTVFDTLVSDRGPLKDAKQVEKIHFRTIECLKAYYQSIGINFNRRFAHIIDRLTEARNLSDSFGNLTMNIIRCWPVMKKYPLLEEFYTHNTI